jgi:prevent-host-death family protein
MSNQEIEIAEAELAELVSAVEHGAEVVLTRNGQPIARMLPPQTTMALASMRGPRKAGSARARFTVPDDLDEPFVDRHDYIQAGS